MIHYSLFKYLGNAQGLIALSILSYPSDSTTYSLRYDYRSHL